MSFFKHLRSSVTRKHNASDETSHHLRNRELSDSSRRRKTRSLFISREDFENEREAEPTADGLVRSETFTINEHDSIFVRNQEVTRASMFGRFSTFTKKNRSNSSGCGNSGSSTKMQKDEELKTTSKNNENLSSSYKRYPTPSDIVSNKSDPFHYLYERGNQQNGAKKSARDGKDLFEKIDYGTYRKNKLSSHIREQLEEEQSPPPDASKSKRNESYQKEKPQDEGEDKFKTVTINSFRKSFRDRFLKQQKEVPYNPSWFIEVDMPKPEVKDEKSHHQNVLVFENEQYRPTARSPIRREYQPPTRSPTKKLSRTPDEEMDERHIHRSQSPGRRHDQSTGQPTGQSRGRSPTARSSRQLDEYSTLKSRSTERSSAPYSNETYRRPSGQSQSRSSEARSPSRHTDQSSTPRSRSPGVHHHHQRSSERAMKQSLARSPNRSPSRDLYYIQSSEERSQPRSRVTVKRNDTFKIDRESSEPSIRIEIKNSITPNEPGRIVPVGVAKPIQSPVHPDITEPQAKGGSSQRKLYQTCIQISSNSRDAPLNRSLRERNSNQTVSNSKLSKKFDPSSNSYISNYSPLKSYELLSNIKPQNNIIPSYDGGYHPRETVRGALHHQQQQQQHQQTTKTTVIPSQAYDSTNKRWINAPTIASQQRVSTYATADKLVRKDPTTNNRNVTANLRRIPSKAPWR